MSKIVVHVCPTLDLIQKCSKLIFVRCDHFTVLLVYDDYSKILACNNLFF